MIGKAQFVVRETGNMFAISLEGFRRTWDFRTWWREYLGQCWFIAKVTSIPVVLISLPFGAVIALQQLQNPNRNRFCCGVEPDDRFIQDALGNDYVQLFAGRRLRVRLGDGRVLTGVASGLADDGRLRLATRKGLRAVTSGRVVSSRPA